MMTLELSSIAKTYNGRRVLHDVSFSASPGDVVGILGANGSGKSTLVKVIAGVIRADSGTVTCIHDGRELDAQARRASCGFVAPYLALYEEFTPHEHLQLHANRSTLQPHWRWCRSTIVHMIASIPSPVA